MAESGNELAAILSTVDRFQELRRRHLASIISEEWPTNGEGTFDLPPLESAANPTALNWRGVRFADVAKELYYEIEDSSVFGNAHVMGVCAKTDKPPEISETDLTWLYKHTPAQVTWANLMHSQLLFIIMAAPALREATTTIGEGFTNSVPLEEAYYSNFCISDVSERSAFWQSSTDEQYKELKSTEAKEHHTLTLVISYTHKCLHSKGILKANEFQIAQLEEILSTIRENPPRGTKFVRLWTDRVNSEKLAAGSASERSKWIFHGLLPYAVFPVAWLSSGEETDGLSMWCTCEHILADGGLGCLFSASYGKSCFPLIGKEVYSEPLPGKAIKTVGDGLSINRNITKLATLVHSGVLDDTVTYHIKDAQDLLRLSYYMTTHGRTGMAHGLNCDDCLHASFRDYGGFENALRHCCDLYNAEVNEDIQFRTNKTQVSYPYPKIRARRGYVDWHGTREFAPGAGRFVRFINPLYLNKHYRNLHIICVSNNGIPSSEYCLLATAYPYTGGSVSYIVLLVHGRQLLSSNCRVLDSVRLNVKDLRRLHDGVQRRVLEGHVNELLRHPKMDELLVNLEFLLFADVSSVSWGVWGLKRTAEKEEEETYKHRISEARDSIDQRIGLSSNVVFENVVSFIHYYCLSPLIPRRQENDLQIMLSFQALQNWIGIYGNWDNCKEMLNNLYISHPHC